MTSEMSVSWDGRPDAEDRLARELYAAADHPFPDDAEAGAGERPRTVGVAVARLDGVLSGWAWVFEESDEVARVQGLYVPREVRRLRSGHAGALAAEAAEAELFTRLYGRAAEEARGAGFRVLRWDGLDSGAEGRAAEALGAQAHGEFARLWTARPAAWRPPTGLPHVQVRSLPEAGLTLATTGARVSATLDGHTALLNAGEAISHRDGDQHRLAALVADLVARLRAAHPEVTELTVHEFDDPTVRQALELAGLRVGGRFLTYDLPLGPSLPHD
ncbi:hypothetical protein ABT160_23010 [Streptomyces sp. NPDC001941]|uniref:hypothetical protein n=1 Tax=Streptomyces sp. NPDC001941 TaxID=3154659 RepID=UPI003333DDA8